MKHHCYDRFQQYNTFYCPVEYWSIRSSTKVIWRSSRSDEVIEECAVGGYIEVPDLRKLNWVREIKSTEDIKISILLELDKGEKYTLQMAKQLNADRVIIDEKIGRDIAEYLDLKVTGTLGILLKAKQNGWIESFSKSAHSMANNGIRFHPKLIEKLAKTVGE